MIGDRADAADGAIGQQPLETRDHGRFVDAGALGDRLIWLGYKRKPGLCHGNDLAVDGVEHCHTSSRKPTKNSRVFGIA
jgi:hypothetical protein